MILICVAFIVVLRYNHILVTNSEVFSQIFLSDSDDTRFCTRDSVDRKLFVYVRGLVRGTEVLVRVVWDESHKHL